MYPAVAMLATKAGDALSWRAVVSGQKLSPAAQFVIQRLLSFGNAGMFFGIPLGLLSLVIGTLYLVVRFRHMNWGYRIAFVVCDALTILGMWTILSIWGQLSK
jgi:hypothetical protein